jgi:sortase A
MRVLIAANEETKRPAGWFIRAAYYVLLAGGIGALAYAGFALLDLYTYQTVEKARFEASRAPAEPSPASAVAAPIADGSVIGEIELPRVGLKAIVVQGDSGTLLRRAVGHLPHTALPGGAGNVALAGHRDGLFRPLRNVLPGDAITLRTPEHDFRYEVEWTAIVPPSAAGVIQPTSERKLTLITCFPFYYVGAAPERFIVRAREVKEATEPGP